MGDCKGCLSRLNMVSTMDFIGLDLGILRLWTVFNFFGIQVFVQLLIALIRLKIGRLPVFSGNLTII